jgi:hypothetical protein
MGMLVFLLLMPYVAFNMSRYAEAVPLLRCLHNWCLYRVWTPCRHVRVCDVRTPVDMGGIGTIYAMTCADCAVVFLRDSFLAVPCTPEDHATTADEVSRSAPRDARRAQLRLWLVRWALPVGRECRRICTYVGAIALTASLVAWVWWAPLTDDLLRLPETQAWSPALPGPLMTDDALCSCDWRNDDQN